MLVILCWALGIPGVDAGSVSALTVFKVSQGGRILKMDHPFCVMRVMIWEEEVSQGRVAGGPSPSLEKVS